MCGRPALKHMRGTPMRLILPAILIILLLLVAAGG